MGLKRRLFDAGAALLTRALRLRRASRPLCLLLEKVQPIAHVPVPAGPPLAFYCPNELTLSRARTFFEKEPETLAWIDSMSDSDVLYDVGANVGLYTVYAARRLKVVAFEPEAQNYALLNRNLHLNGLWGKVTGLNVALSDADELGGLNMPEYQAGTGLNALGAARDWRGEDFAPAFRQGVLAMTLDTFLSRYQAPFPSHLKLDVDGIELKILKGASKTLRDRRLNSVQVEINEGSDDAGPIRSLLEESGLSLKSKGQSAMIAASEFRQVFNCVFARRYGVRP